MKFNVEMIFLPDEMFSQKGRHFRMVVGRPIRPADLQRIGTLRQQADYVREKAYFLQNSLAR